MGLPNEVCHGENCPDCQSFQENWEVEAGWRCRDCRTPLPSPKGRFGTSRACKSCTSGRTASE